MTNLVKEVPMEKTNRIIFQLISWIFCIKSSKTKRPEVEISIVCMKNSRKGVKLIKSNRHKNKGSNRRNRLTKLTRRYSVENSWGKTEDPSWGEVKTRILREFSRATSKKILTPLQESSILVLGLVLLAEAAVWIRKWEYVQ
jgi:hypothetical protein